MQIIIVDSDLFFLTRLSMQMRQVFSTDIVVTFSDTERALHYAKTCGVDMLVTSLGVKDNRGILFIDKMKTINRNLILVVVGNSVECTFLSVQVQPYSLWTKPVDYRRVVGLKKQVDKKRVGRMMRSWIG